MGAVWLRARAGLRQDWRGLVVLALITGLLGGVVLAALAGARRTDTAVPRFLQYSGPTEGQVTAGPGLTRRIAALPDVAYTARGSLMFALPVTAGGRLAAAPGQVLTWAVIQRPPAARMIEVAGRPPAAARVTEVAINETAARLLQAGTGSLIRLRGYRPDQLQQVLNGTGRRQPPGVRLPAVRVTGIVRTPTDLTENPDAPADVSFIGNGAIYATAAFYHRYSASVAHFAGLSFHLKRGPAGLPAFEAQVRRLAGGRAQLETGSDDRTAAAAAQRGTSLQAFALLLFAVILGLSVLVIVGQSLARQVHASSGDFPVLRAVGISRGQLFAVTLVPAALVAAGGMALAVPVAYGLSGFTPVGLALRAETSPGPEFNAGILLGGAAGLALLLAARAAIAALRAAGARGSTAAAETGSRGSRMARWMARRGLPATVVSGARLAFEPGRDRTAVPVRSAIIGTAVAIAAVVAALVFGSSLANVIARPAVTGWNWDVTVGNPHSGDISAQAVPGLRADPRVAGFTATAMGGAMLNGHEVTVVGMRRVSGDVTPPVLAGRLPRGPGEIALAGRELRAVHARVGDVITARGARGPVTLRVTGQVVLSPEITNEQVQLGSGAVMTLSGADALDGRRLPANVFLVRLHRPAGPAAVARLKLEFPGVVLPAIPPPEVRDLRGVSGLPLALALLVTLLAAGTVTHTLLTSVRRRRRDLAILKTVGFVGRQVRAAVAWQATALAASGLLIGLPLGVAAGRWGWILFAGQFAIEPVPVISIAVLLAIPAVLMAANVVAAIPAETAARTRPAAVLRAE